MSTPTTFICDFTEHPLVWVDSLNNEGSSQRPHMRRRTVGMLDMGGGSFQIAFEVTGKVSNITMRLNYYETFLN